MMKDANLEANTSASPDASNPSDPAIDDGDDGLPDAGEMTLEEIEEDFDYLFFSHVGGTVTTTWGIATFVTMFVLLVTNAKTIDALITLGILVVLLFPCYILSTIVASRIITKSPDSRFKYKFVWLVSLLFNGPTGIVLVKMPHERIKEMFARRCELLRKQEIEPYSPVDDETDRKWRALGSLLFEKVPLGAAFALQGWFICLLLVAIVAGVGALVHFVMSP